MDPTSQSVHEPVAYRMVREALTTLMQAEHALAIVQQATPDPERASHLASLLIAIEVLGTSSRRPRGRQRGRDHE